MKHEEIEKLRKTRGQSVLLFITDRCPVECAHCSVDSRADSPGIHDFELFSCLVDGICKQQQLKVVGISGGEPFVERKALAATTAKLRRHNKSVVIYTSGVWAKARLSPPWIKTVLKACSTVYLSTDTFHQKTVSPVHFMRAAEQIALAGAWIVVQTLDPDTTRALMEITFGSEHEYFAEIVPLTPLRNGRGEGLFNVQRAVPATQYGSCSLAVTPVVRYDGVVTACCNENVIMGKGPTRLRQKAKNTDHLVSILKTFESDTLMRCVADLGLGAMLNHPRLKGLVSVAATNPCDVCWPIMDEFPDFGHHDRLIDAMAHLGDAQ